MSEEIETRLKRLSPAGPSPELGHRIMYAARAEAVRYTAWDGVWGSRAFWRSIAAAAIIAFVLPHIPFADWRGGGRGAPQIDPEAAALAETLAEMAGDGPTTARRIAMQLSGPPAANASARQTWNELLEALEWQE